MQWPIFIIYTLVVWLVFDKWRLMRLSLPVALFFASAGPIIIFLALVAMNFYHPGSADVRMLQRVVQITPRVSSPGRVAEMAVKPETRMKRGETLFRIDPTPFEYDVHRLEAALAAAEQSVQQLKASLDQATAARAAPRRRSTSRSRPSTGSSSCSSAGWWRRRPSTQQPATSKPPSRAAGSSRRGPRPARPRVQHRGREHLRGAGAAAARGGAHQSRRRRTSRPLRRFASNVNILPGAIVSAAASVMPFVCDQEQDLKGKVVATFDQASFLAVQPGEYAEVIFSMYPGQVFTGKVESVVDITTGGALAPSGAIPNLSPPGKPRFAAVIKLDNPDLRFRPALRARAPSTPERSIRRHATDGIFRSSTARSAKSAIVASGRRSTTTTPCSRRRSTICLC